MPLNEIQVAALLATPAQDTVTGKRAIVIKDGVLSVVSRDSIKSDAFGKFHGRAGGIRRTRKGATRRLANGSRFYLHGEGEVQVIGYDA